MSFILFFRQGIDDVNILLENLPNLIMEEAPRTIIKNNKRRGEQVLITGMKLIGSSHNRWTFCLPRRKEMVIIFCPSILSSNPILKIFLGEGEKLTQNWMNDGCHKILKWSWLHALFGMKILSWSSSSTADENFFPIFPYTKKLFSQLWWPGNIIIIQWNSMDFIRLLEFE